MHLTSQPRHPLFGHSHTQPDAPLVVPSLLCLTQATPALVLELLQRWSQQAGPGGGAGGPGRGTHTASIARMERLYGVLHTGLIQEDALAAAAAAAPAVASGAPAAAAAAIVPVAAGGSDNGGRPCGPLRAAVEAAFAQQALVWLPPPGSGSGAAVQAATQGSSGGGTASAPGLQRGSFYR